MELECWNYYIACQCRTPGSEISQSVLFCSKATVGRIHGTKYRLRMTLSSVLLGKLFPYNYPSDELCLAVFCKSSSTQNLNKPFIFGSWNYITQNPQALTSFWCPVQQRVRSVNLQQWVYLTNTPYTLCDHPATPHTLVCPLQFCPSSDSVQTWFCPRPGSAQSHVCHSPGPNPSHLLCPVHISLHSAVPYWLNQEGQRTFTKDIVIEEQRNLWTVSFYLNFSVGVRTNSCRWPPSYCWLFEALTGWSQDCVHFLSLASWLLFILYCCWLLCIGRWPFMI